MERKNSAKSVASDIDTHLRKRIELARLGPEVTGRDIDAALQQAIRENYAGICVPPFWVKRAWRDTRNEELKLVTVIGFPFGYQMTETKMEEARLALRDGADELDVVINISAIKDGIPWPKIELAKLSKLIHEAGKIFKVIIEYPLLERSEVERACKISVDAGADFIKTSTGTTGQAVTPEQITHIKSLITNDVGIKASGGIRSVKEAVALISAGADTLGVSHPEKWT